MVFTDESRIPAISKFLLTIINGRKSLAINEEGYILYVTGVLDPYTVSFLADVRVTGILCRFRLVLEGQASGH